MTPNYFTKICIETRDKMRDKRWYQLFSQDMYFWNKNVDLYHWYIIDSGSLNALLIVYKCLLIYYIQWITYCFRVLNGSEFNKVQIISYYIMHSRGGPFLIQPSRCIFIYLFIKCIVEEDHFLFWNSLYSLTFPSSFISYEKLRRVIYPETPSSVAISISCFDMVSVPWFQTKQCNGCIEYGH